MVDLNVACKPEGPTFKTVLNFECADDTSIFAKLATCFDDFLSSSDHCSIDTLTNQFYSIINECIAQFVPHKSIKRHAKHPWYTRSIIQLKRRIKRLQKRRRVHNNDGESQINLLKSELKAKMSDARKFYFNTTLSSFMKNNPIKFWKTINPTTACPSTFMIDDVSCSDSSKISEAFNKYFQTVFGDDNGTTPDIRSSQEIDSFPAIEISYTGVLNLLLNIDTTKGAGPDGIPNMFLKRYAEWNARYLSIIFVKSLETGIVPTVWKIANVIPVFKSGNKQLISNYRPISLTCTCCKLLEHIIHKHVLQHLTNNNLLSRNQHGFRSGFSTTTQLIEFTHDIASALNTRGQVDAIFIDYSKAFDVVCHKKLLTRLRSIINDDKIIGWIADWLRLRSQFVTFEHAQSSSCAVTSGVPQGSVLGPLLFIIYINDVTQVIKDTPVKLRLYADDCVLYTSVNNAHDQDVLNKVFSSFCGWSATWQMNINYQKTVQMTFTNKKQPLRFSYSYNGHYLNSVNTFKYLGVTYTQNLKWHHHIETICARALRKLGYIKRTLKHSTKDCKLTAYKSLVRPLLEYASAVWSPYTALDINMLEGIQKKAIRFIFGRYDRNFSPSSHACSLSLEPLAFRRTLDRITLLHKIVRSRSCIEAPITFCDSARQTTRRSHPLNIVPFQPFVNCFKHSFFPAVVEIWNNLDGSLREKPIELFLKELPNHIL